MKVKRKTYSSAESDVIEYIEKNIRLWLRVGYAPCQSTTINMQASIFKDVTAYEFNSILKEYCIEHGIHFKHGVQKRVDSRTLRCYTFSKR